MTRVWLTAFAVLIAWILLGGALGIAGFLLTSHIPFAGLGIFLSMLGGITHFVLVVFSQRTQWWKVGVWLSVMLSLFSILGGTLAGNRFPLVFILFFLSYYFVFGSLIYFLIQKFFVPAILEK